MIVKPYRDRDADLQELERLSTRRDCSPGTRAQIEAECRKIRAGQKGERAAAYSIDFHLARRDDWAVIHDLRLEWLGRVAQIDHLLINRVLDVWVCESKHFSDGVAINEHGEFTAFFQGRPRGIESPLEQNHRHVKVLDSVLGSSICALPRRLGIEIRPKIRSVVLVSATGRITRPKQPFPGLETIVKADQLRSTINATVEAMSVTETLLTGAKVIGVDTLRAFAEQLAALHRPVRFDWASRFRMDQEVNSFEAVRSPARGAQVSEEVRPAEAARPLAPLSPPPKPQSDSRLPSWPRVWACRVRASCLPDSRSTDS